MIKKILKTTAVSAAALVALSTGMMLINKNPGTENEAQADENVTAFYTVREYESIVGVFADESSAPEKVHSLFVRVLPEADRAALKDGICVSSENELRSLIEDLTG